MFLDSRVAGGRKHDFDNANEIFSSIQAQSYLQKDDSGKKKGTIYLTIELFWRENL